MCLSKIIEKEIHDYLNYWSVCLQTWEVVQSPNSWPALNEPPVNGLSSPVRDQSSKKVLIILVAIFEVICAYLGANLAKTVANT